MSRPCPTVEGMPAASAPAEVFLPARPYPGRTWPLRLAANGGEAPAVEP